MISYEETCKAFDSIAKNHGTSIDRDQLCLIKHSTTPEQRLQWLSDINNFAKETQKSAEKRRNNK